MTTFLILLPFAIYAALMLLVSATPSLAAGAACCLAVVLWDVANGRSIKLLSAGSGVVFATLACYCSLVDPAMSQSSVRIAVDSGIFVLSLGSILIGRPFTLQYAIETVPAETAAKPGFVRANYIITAAWTLAAALMAAGNVLQIVLPDLPLWTGLAIAFAARNCAIYFTRWYPGYRRLKEAAMPASAALSAQ
jgi:hypothetical protein